MRPASLAISEPAARVGESDAHPSDGMPLTPRQREVLVLLAEGVRVREIGEQLGLAETTVRNHVRAILSRLDCHSQLEAVAKARRLGLV